MNPYKMSLGEIPTLEFRFISLNNMELREMRYILNQLAMYNDFIDSNLSTHFHSYRTMNT